MIKHYKIKDIGDFFGGLTGKTKEDFGIGDAKYVTYMTVFSNPQLPDNISDYVSISDNEKQNKIQKGDILFTGSSETPDECGMSCVVTKEIEDDIYLNSFCFGLRPSNNEIAIPEYLSHYFRSNHARKQISKTANGVTRFNISKKILADVEILIPSIKEQEKIAEILDSFTNLIDALNEELSLRQKQFEYYREKLLTFDDNTNRYCLKEVFETKNGYTPSTSNKEYWDNGNIPWFRMEDIRQNGRILNDSALHITQAGVKGNRLFKANSIIIATSATIGEHALILVEHLSNQRFTNFYPNEDFEKKINMKYIYYYMFIIDEWCKSHVNQGGFASVDMDGLFKLSIPIPSLAIQQSIVEKLDAFESLISSLKEEIALRQKQYEYYREKLLTFN